MIKRFRDLLAEPSAHLILRLTALFLFFHTPEATARVSGVLPALCGVVLLGPSMVTSRLLWAALAAVVTVPVFAYAWTSDNHHFLAAYWCVACALAVFSDRGEEVLAWNARWLIGLCFLFALFWKVWAGEYSDGSFLYYQMLADGRLAGPSAFLDHSSAETLAANRFLIESLKRFPGDGLGVTLISGGRLALWARLASWWTLAIEAALAFVFLCRTSEVLRRLRDGLLVLFVVTTYPVLPVHSFAALLAVLGFAQCGGTAWRAVYVGLFFAVPLL